MEQRRQQYCATVGNTVLMACGLLALAGWQSIARSASVRAFEGTVCWMLLAASLCSLLLGGLGVAAACRWNRCLLCTHAGLAFLLSLCCTIAGVTSMLQADSDTTRIERFCEEVRAAAHRPEDGTGRSDEEGAIAVGVAATLRGEPEAVASQRAYDSLLQGLLACRQKTPMALALSEEDCRGSSDRAGQPWEAVALQELFVWAEDQHSCGGFCRDGPPLFALPEGTVDDFNKGDFRGACFEPLVEEVRALASTACWLLLTLGTFLLAPLCCSCWLACAPPPAWRDDYVHRPEELRWTRLPQDPEEVDEAEED